MKTFLFAVLSLFLFQIQAQYSGTILSRNNVSMYISNSGTQFNNPGSGGAYLVPKTDDIAAIYSASFLYMGKDINGNTHAALGGSINPNFGTDVFVGPFATDFTDGSYANQWSTCIYEICQEEIDVFVTWWECLNGIPNPDCATATTPSNEVINKIYNWPAHGNLAIGQAYYLLPFIDRNGDGIYNPDDGDHPLIKGCCGTYIIQNDRKDIHTYTGTDPIGIEMQYYFYQYSTADYMNDASFVEITTINRGTISYPEFRYGMYIDGDLGNFSDDYIGSDSIRNMAYFYNADNYDQPDFGQPAYGAAPPALGFVGLQDTINAVVQFTTASSTEEWWDVLGGYENGFPQQHPDGYITQLAYSGDPNIPSEWSEVSAGNPGSEKRMVIGSSRNNFLPGDTIKQTYAILYARSGDNLQSVTKLKELADSVLNFYQNPYDPGCIGSVLSTEELSSEFEIYPNPFTGILHLETNLVGATEISVFDVTGKLVWKNASSSIPQHLDLSSLSAGHYQLQVNTGQTNSVFRIIKE
ncbi:MAG: T9SS type A sorting domain-containing protein [Bacteroidetes bacterium]|nr:MAG: T9SS type A sorting domain-containing protein [Bacteroidota bacterium]